MLQFLGLRLVQIGEQLDHLFVSDEAGRAFLRILGYVTAWIRAIGAVAPQLGQVEHLAHARQHSIGLRWGFLHALHQRDDIVARDLVSFLTAEGRDDVSVDLVLVAALRAWLVAHLGVILHEPFAQFLDRRSLAGLGLIVSGVAAVPDFGQPVLRQRTGLFDGQLAELAERRLAAHAGVRAVLEHEDFAARWCNLAQEARNDRVPEFNVAGSCLSRANNAFGQFDLRHDVLLKGLNSRSLLGARRKRTGAVCVTHRHMIQNVGSTENLLQQALSKPRASRCGLHAVA
ncbi:hypothetical protein D9M69_512130 [compost metagenome]